MRPLHPLPTLWLMTDARNRGRVLDAIAALPRGSGVVFRDGDLAREARRRHFRAVTAACARRGHVLLVGGAPVRGDWRAQGRHGSRRRDLPLCSRAVHDAGEAARARREGADVCFVSPVWPTRSHPGTRVLGRWGFARLARLCPEEVVALGGLSKERWERVRPFGAYGWAAIDSLSAARGHKSGSAPSKNPRNSDCS